MQNTGCPFPEAAAAGILPGWPMIKVFGTVAAGRVLARRCCLSGLRPAAAVVGHARQRTVRELSGCLRASGSGSGRYRGLSTFS